MDRITSGHGGKCGDVTPHLVNVSPPSPEPISNISSLFRLAPHIPPKRSSYTQHGLFQKSQFSVFPIFRRLCCHLCLKKMASTSRISSSTPFRDPSRRRGVHAGSRHGVYFVIYPFSRLYLPLTNHCGQPVGPNCDRRSAIAGFSLRSVTILWSRFLNDYISDRQTVTCVVLAFFRAAPRSSVSL